jgi:tyrosine-protein phosphatase MSG5
MGGSKHVVSPHPRRKLHGAQSLLRLIYQLLDYERVFQSGHTSPSSSVRSSQGNDEEEEWARQRMVMEAAESPIDNEAESSAFFNEAKALDLEMEERNVARKVSQSSFTSSSSTGHGMGAVWKSRYGFGSVRRARTGSTSSNRTTRSSTLSEELPEEEEGEGDSSGNTDANKLSPSTAATDDESHQWSQELTIPSDLSRLSVPQLGQFKPPPSAPVSKMSFSLPSRTGGKNKVKYRPSPLTALLPPVPPSPVPATAPIQEDLSSKLEAGPGNLPSLPVRRRTESRRPIPPPLHLRPTTRPRGQGSISSLSSNSSSVALSTPSQTLFVFPPSPTSNPSTMMLTATQPGFLPFPSLLTPRVSSMTKQGRTRSFIGLGAPPTPTTAFSIVEVRGTLNTPITATSSRSRK